jgi:hypothetical protein|tara:strand:- start:144 stop:560 length:417 start_codon:yes stop_codon:yes gene_type:complete
MKEKITLIIILSSVVVLLFHHQSRDQNIQLTSVEVDVLTQPDIPSLPLELVEDNLKLPLKGLLEIDECKIDLTATDNLPFKDVFSHFRNCLGSNQEFSWKGQLYMTLLAEEVDNEVIHVGDSTIVEAVNGVDLEVVIR